MPQFAETMCFKQLFRLNFAQGAMSFVRSNAHFVLYNIISISMSLFLILTLDNETGSIQCPDLGNASD